jgi:MFS family permease
VTASRTHGTEVAAKTGRRRALRFILLIGLLSFFADFTYEGSRSILGPYLLTLGASGAVVGTVMGLGEFLGYGLRLVSGRWADVSGRYWPITIFGYVVQMASVPLLALTGSWPAAACLIVIERAGKAIRNPPRDVMLSHAGKQAGGYGWAFGLHEAMDQTGAMIGPLAIAAILAKHGTYHQAFAALAVPAVINLSLVMLASRLYPTPQDLDKSPPVSFSEHLPRLYWMYLLGAVLVAAGFADYPLIAFHFSKTGAVPADWIATFYAVAMGVSGAGSLAFGRLFDRFGFSVLVALTLVSAAFAPLVFLGGFWSGLIGAAVWGLGMGAHESIIPAAIAPMAPAQRRATAYGIFTAAYGIFWFIGSAIIGVLYDVSLESVVAFCIITQLAAVFVFLLVARQSGQMHQ